jgi:hypothetical protein
MGRIPVLAVVAAIQPPLVGIIRFYDKDPPIANK